MNKAALVGIGNCGSQIAWLAEQKYPELFECIYVNTSSVDLSMVGTEESLKIKIGEHSEEPVEGSGKNRAKMKDYLEADLAELGANQALLEAIGSKKYCYVICSTAGGTGSGATPAFFEMLRAMIPCTNFILVAVLPQIGASLMEQGNSLEFLNELYDVLGDQTTYMIYDNEMVTDMSPTKGLEKVNEEVVEDLKVLSGIDNYATPYESIDDADMEAIISTPGRLLVARIPKGLTEKTMEDSNLSDLLVKAIKNSKHAETDRNKRVIRWGIITFFTDQVNKLYNPNLEGLIDFLGTPVERFNHNALNSSKEDLNFLYFIASGLSPINDRVTKITNRIDELKAAMAADESKKYVLADTAASYDVMEERKKADRKARTQQPVDLNDIMKRFKK